MSERRKKDNPIPPWNRFAVDATTAAQMFSIGRSTFFARVKDGIYPKPANDGLWRVSDLRRLAEATSTTMPSVPGAASDIRPGYMQPAQHQSPGEPVAAQ